LVWDGQEEFECEDKSKELNDVQQKEHHLITCMSGTREKKLYESKTHKIPRLVENLKIVHRLSTSTDSEIGK
jgi:hypothetical protein